MPAAKWLAALALRRGYGCGAEGMRWLSVPCAVWMDSARSLFLGIDCRRGRRQAIIR
jgi:hypothetical protein